MPGRSTPLARIGERRAAQRRRFLPETLVFSPLVFAVEERRVFREIERRSSLRREADVRRRVAAL
jgi:hypothetical protein